jgi:glycosyltransferase involved in cell wall biosynthesis
VNSRPRILITVGADTARESNAGPRRDYAVTAAALNATVLDRRSVNQSRAARLIARIIGVPAAQAWLAFRLRGRYEAILTDGEHVGIPLALLLRLTRSPVRHVTIGHRLTAKKKRAFFRVLGVAERMDRIAVHSRIQRERAVDDLGIASRRLDLIPYQVDTRYWAPRDVAEDRLIVSAGLEHRDYATLFRAVAGLDAPVIIGAASYWSRHHASQATAPANVRIDSFDYAALRDLYARAALVVVPLMDIDNQAGVTTLLEAMAMGKAVVVTQSAGQTDVIEDRRVKPRGALRQRPLSLTRLLADRAGLHVEPTGFYVAPGDADGLRAAITYLLDHPEERARLGRAGRRIAEELFTIELFAERLGSIVLDTLRPAYETSTLSRATYG